MKRFKPAVIVLAIFMVFQVSCQNKGKVVLISTEFGDMKVRLYEETPLHSDNFIKLVEEGYYDSLLFHRVIKEFMIQGGDPESKNADSAAMLGNGGPDYEVPAEFVDGLIHKKGVIAAAREGDNVNPEKKSSGSQFYIVQGRVFTNDELNMLEERMNMRKKQEIIFNFVNKPENSEYKRKADSLYMNQKQAELQQLLMELEELTKPEFEASNPYKFSDKQREVYTTVGGAPFLDGQYTVFGEVIEGLDVIDKIAEAKTDENDRPVQDIRMYMKKVRK